MATSISNSLTSTSAYLTQQTVQAKSASISADRKSASDVKSTTDSVTLSPMARQMAAQATTWSTLSKTELKGVYDRSWDSIVQLDNKFQNSGMAAFDADIPADGTPEQIAHASQIRDYMVSVHSSPPGKVANPYAGYSREALSSILYDESGTYTQSEKYAAVEEQQKQDFTYFSALFASNSISEDHREMYKGILAFYDKLSPVEQSVYPAGYREEVSTFLKQQETLFGALSDNDKKAATNQMKNVSAAASLNRDEPIWAQLVAATSKISDES